MLLTSPKISQREYYSGNEWMKPPMPQPRPTARVVIGLGDGLMPTTPVGPGQDGVRRLRHRQDEAPAPRAPRPGGAAGREATPSGEGGQAVPQLGPPPTVFSRR